MNESESLTLRKRLTLKSRSLPNGVPVRADAGDPQAPPTSRDCTLTDDAFHRCPRHDFTRKRPYSAWGERTEV